MATQKEFGSREKCFTAVCNIPPAGVLVVPSQFHEGHVEFRYHLCQACRDWNKTLLVPSRMDSVWHQYQQVIFGDQRLLLAGKSCDCAILAKWNIAVPEKLEDGMCSLCGGA